MTVGQLKACLAEVGDAVQVENLAGVDFSREPDTLTLVGRVRLVAPVAPATPQDGESPGEPTGPEEHVSAPRRSRARS